MNNIKRIRDIIKANGSAIMRITYEKKDGSERKMSANPRFVKLVDEYKSESAKQAVATRKANHPNLMSVMDIQLKRKGEPDYKCWRSVNLETVKEVKSHGKVYRSGIDF